MKLPKIARVFYHHFQNSEISPFVNNQYKKDGSYPDLKSPENYARFIMPEKLQQVKYCLWMDADTIVQGDVYTYLHHVIKKMSKFAIAAFPRSVPTVSTSAISALKKEGFSIQGYPHFNAGVVIYNLEKWREKNISETIKELCLSNAKHNYWRSYGSQPPLILLLGGKEFFHLNNANYYGQLGYKRRSRIPKTVMFLHWNGKHKPWKKMGYHKKIWLKYATPGLGIR